MTLNGCLCGYKRARIEPWATKTRQARIDGDFAVTRCRVIEKGVVAMAAAICEGSRLLQKSQGYLAGWLTVPAARYQHLSNAMMVAKIMSLRRLCSLEGTLSFFVVSGDDC